MTERPLRPSGPPPRRAGRKQALEVALIDVGGTLWPNSWPLREADGDGRHRRVAKAMPDLSPDGVDSLVTDLMICAQQEKAQLVPALLGSLTTL